jgi:hypothetical protein
MEDLIDFPCSPDWLEYYHLRGLTPRRPVREPAEADRELRAIREGLENLTAALTRVLERLSAEPAETERENRSDPSLVSELAVRVARLERQLEALSRAVRSREAGRSAVREEKPKKERRGVHVAQV